MSVIIGLGANLDHPEHQLQRAVAALDELPGTRVNRCSAVYRSAPMGPQDQPDFLNACVLIETSLPPDDLLAALKAIEHTQGRTETRRWGERCIDLDLLTYNAATCQTETLTLPHPGIEQRDFVLRPMLDLLGPAATLPNGKRVSECLAGLTGHNLVRTDIELTTPPRRAVS